MRIEVLIPGLMLLILVVIDIVWTTIWVEGGAGPVSRLIMKGHYQWIQFVHERWAKLAKISGPLMLITILTTWILLLWLAWCLILYAIPGGITSRGDTVTNLLDYFFHTGNILFTLGSGDYVVNSQLIKGLDGVIAGMGMMFLTLGVSFTIGVVEGVVMGRSLAMSIRSLVPESKYLVKKAWTGEGFHSLGTLLMPLSSQISELAYRLQAYPLLAYYQSSEEKYDLPLVLARLNQELNLLIHRVEENSSLNPLILESCQNSIDDYFASLNVIFHGKVKLPDPKSSMDVSDLKKVGIPLTEKESEEKNVWKEMGIRKKKPNEGRKTIIN